MGFQHDKTDGAFLYGPSGQVIWASSNKQAYWTDYITGSFTVPSITGSAGVVSTQTIDVDDVSSNATDVMGWFRTTSSDLSGVVSGAVHQLGGTTLLRVDFAGEFTSISTSGPGMYPDSLDPRYTTWTTSNHRNYCGCIAITTFISGGKLRATIDRNKPLDLLQNFASMTINYWAFALTFDN